jgi:hypothetical protein
MAPNDLDFEAFAFAVKNCLKVVLSGWYWFVQNKYWEQFSVQFNANV